MTKYFWSLLLVLACSLAHASDKVTFGKYLKSTLIGRNVYTLEDKSGRLSFNDVIHSKNFISVDKDVVNFQTSQSSFWMKFTIANLDNDERNYIEIEQPMLDEIDFYYQDSLGNYQVINTGQKYPFYQRPYGKGTNFLFDLNVKPGQEKTYYVRITGKQQILVPIKLISAEMLDAENASRSIWFGIYCGIILVMFLYNIFVYFSVRERSYVYYVWHTLFVGLTQASLTGYTYKYLWPNSPWFGNYSVFLFTCLVSIMGVQFLIEFMHLKKNAPTMFKVLKVFQAIYVVYIFTSMFGLNSQTFQAILPTQSTIALVILGLSIYLIRKGFSEAKFYLIGWSSLLIGIIIYVTKDFGVLPYNNFTASSLLLGSAGEVTLLSFALADKINIFKAEKERSQEETVKALQENERIVREQNVMLEKKVNERTQELQVANDDLNKTMIDLKEAQAQLVDSEKMASLGQLTAGIAHEINNPINFVTSNVNPLKRDVEILMDAITTIETVGLSDAAFSEKQKQIEEYKEEIDFDYLKIEINHLLKGINEGASRTAEIVKGLRVFSRLDEDDLKKADINEGLDSTLVIVNNLMNNKIQLVKEYGNIPLIECYPGKLNQVFLNIITNAIHAINKRYGDEPNGILKISTSNNEKSIFVKIEDNGTGMDENTKKKIFEPFFTTKDVGEGTGLGMSIAYNTIKKHNGQIYVNTTLGVGTEFIMDIPIIHEIS